MISVGRLTQKENALQAYLLGETSLQRVLALQRRLVFDVSGAPDTAALILCEHPTHITVGREGSWKQIAATPEELQHRGVPVRWVNRGGGCFLHSPGQIACYAILSLHHHRLGVADYLCQLRRIVHNVLADFDILADVRAEGPGAWVERRMIADMGVAVRDWVAYYGFVLNVSPVLDQYRLLRSGNAPWPVTSLERQRRGPVRVSRVRERLVDRFAEQFAFSRTSLFFEHPSLGQRVSPDALATHA